MLFSYSYLVDERFMWFIYHPMDLNTMESKCSQDLYGGIEEFQADAENIFHNIMICYGENAKMTGMV